MVERNTPSPLGVGRGEGTPLLEVRDLARYFDVSPPWLNRVFERMPISDELRQMRAVG